MVNGHAEEQIFVYIYFIFDITSVADQKISKRWGSTLKEEAPPTK
jgi:hypothetical protein